ncbi:MAG: hypothetical protein NTV52_27700 [Acidobacteria bacterium]|nr:hypothetical protein [Acidobacteriota bacterium]
MGSYKRRFRSCPLSVALVLPALYVWFVWPALGGGWRSVWQLGPVMTLFTYGVLVCFCNHVRVEATARGTWKRVGPLPVGPQAPPVRRESIGQVYVRQIDRREKGVTRRWLAAGVRRMDGACLDLTEQTVSDVTVRYEAAEVAAALGWKEPIVEIADQVHSLEQSMLYAYLFWAGLLLLSLVWIGVAGAIFG